MPLLKIRYNNDSLQTQTDSWHLSHCVKLNSNSVYKSLQTSTTTAHLMTNGNVSLYMYMYLPWVSNILKLPNIAIVLQIWRSF